MTTNSHLRTAPKSRSSQYATEHGYDPESYMSFVSDELLESDDIYYGGAKDNHMLS